MSRKKCNLESFSFHAALSFMSANFSSHDLVEKQINWSNTMNNAVVDWLAVLKSFDFDTEKFELHKSRIDDYDKFCQSRMRNHCPESVLEYFTTLYNCNPHQDWDSVADELSIICNYFDRGLGILLEANLLGKIRHLFVTHAERPILPIRAGEATFKVLCAYEELFCYLGLEGC